MDIFINMTLLQGVKPPDPTVRSHHRDNSLSPLYLLLDTLCSIGYTSIPSKTLTSQEERLLKTPHLSFTMAVILQAVENGYRYGFEVLQATGLASGTIYPALRRLEDALLIKSKWENPKIAQAEQRPTRKYYEVTKAGREVLVEARNRFKLLEQIDSPTQLKPAGKTS